MAASEAQGSGEANPAYDGLVRTAIFHIDAGAMGNASDTCGKAIAVAADRCEAYFVLSVAAYLIDDLGRAIDLASQGHDLAPECSEGCDLLAHYHTHAGKLNDGVYYAKLAEAGEKNTLLAKLKVEGLDDLAAAMNEARETSYRVDALRALNEERYSDCVQCCEKELRLRDGDAELFSLFGRGLTGCGKISQGIAALHAAIHLEPENPDNYLHIALAYSTLGEFDMAKACCDRALRLDRVDGRTLGIVSHICHLLPRSWLELDSAIEQWRGAGQQTKAQTIQATDDDDRPLRVGYLVDRACAGEALRAIEALLWHYDRDRIDVYVYSVDLPNDSMPDKLSGLCTLWLDTRDINDEAVVRSMEAHKLDVLVDLSMTPEGHRPGVIASHPARTVLRGLCPSGGVFAYGYDGDLGAGRGGIACAIGFDPKRLPNVEGKSPFHVRGKITYGAVCDPARITPHVAMTWARILLDDPASRLALGGIGEIPPEAQARLESIFSAFGVIGRLDFVPASSGPSTSLLVQRLEFFVGVDVCLDTFPLSGFIDLADALWCGVPVISLSGCAHGFGEQFLKASGQEKWLAADEADYIVKALDAARAVSENPEFRQEMHSAVCDTQLFQPEKSSKILSDMLEEACRES